jgi:hypothetical protein
MIGNLIASIGGTGAIPLPTPPVSGYSVWLDGADTSTITVSGTAVTQWTDKSVNAYTFTQGTSGNRPISGVTTKNGYNVIDFDGTNDYLGSTNSASTWDFLSSTAGQTFFLVGSMSSSATTSAAYLGTGNGTAAAGFVVELEPSITQFGQFSSNGTGSGSIVYNNYQTSSWTGNTYYYWTLQTNYAASTPAARGYWQRNLGSTVATNTYSATPAAAGHTLFIGATNTNSGNPAEYFYGSIAEILIYPSYLSAGNVTSIQSYLSTKWGI